MFRRRFLPPLNPANDEDAGSFVALEMGGCWGPGDFRLRRGRGRGTIWALALRAAGASRTYRRAVPAANGSSGASRALESLDGNPYPPIRA